MRAAPDPQALFAPETWLSDQGGPRYLQLKRRIEEAIETHQLAPGSPLPPERELARITGLSRVTVRKAVAPLVAAGLIEQRRGSGRVVAARPGRVSQSLSRLTSFSEDMSRRGAVPSSVWITRGVFLPSPDEIMALGLAPEQSVARLERLRLADGRPMAIERAALPTSILENPMDVEDSLYDLLARLGRRPVRAVQHIRAALLSRGDARMLGAAEGDAALQITRISYLASGQIAECTRSVYRGDSYDFVAELTIPQTAPQTAPEGDPPPTQQG